MGQLLAQRHVHDAPGADQGPKGDPPSRPLLQHLADPHRLCPLGQRPQGGQHACGRAVVALGLSALKTGARILPLSLTLLAAAILIPRFLPDVSPRRVVRLGILSLFAGAVVLMAALDADAGAEVVTVPLLLIGLGVGALASQLGSVTVSAVPDERSAEVGGVQNAVMNLGSSIGTALAGSVLIAALTSSFLANVEQNPEIPDQVKTKASVELQSGVPFLSDAQLKAAMDEAGTSTNVTQAATDANADARLDGLRAALAILALTSLLAMFFTHRIPTTQPRST